MRLHLNNISDYYPDMNMVQAVRNSLPQEGDACSREKIDVAAAVDFKLRLKCHLGESWQYPAPQGRSTTLHSTSSYSLRLNNDHEAGPERSPATHFM
jgi:hypothetical protein